MSVHIEVILDKNKKQKYIIIIYTNFPQDYEQSIWQYL